MGQRFDVVFDTVNTLSRADVDTLVVSKGHHINLNPGPPIDDDYPSIFAAQLTKMTRDRLERVAALAVAGLIRAQIGERFTLDAAIDTLAQVENGSTTHAGKPVMEMST